MIRSPRRARRGFSLLELMIAGAVFLVGVLGITLAMLYSSRQASVATARGNMTRLANRVHQDVVQRGYDGLTDGSTVLANVHDTMGRPLNVTVDVIPTVDAATGCNSLLGANPLPPVQTCCANNICCRLVRTTAQWREAQGSGLVLAAPLVMTSFVTRGCP